jgi:hypothetical protein
VRLKSPILDKGGSAYEAAMAAVVASAAAASNHLTPVDNRGSGAGDHLSALLAPKIRRKPMSHNVVPPLKSPAPGAPEAMTLWNRVQRLWTLSSTEEVFHEDGTSKRVRRVRRSIRM